MGNDLMNERVVRLETQSETLEKLLKDIQTKVDSLHDEMTKYKGFLGAITFIGSSVVVALGLFKDSIINHWK